MKSTQQTKKSNIANSVYTLILILKAKLHK